MTSIKALIDNAKTPPSGKAVESAVKADLRTIADMVPNCDVNLSPRSAQDRATKRLFADVGFALMSDVLSDDALDIIQTVIACEKMRNDSVYGGDYDADEITEKLTEYARAYAGDTVEEVQTHCGVAE